MTSAPSGQSKAAAENEDAVTNAASKPRSQRTAGEQSKVDKAVESEPSDNTDARARKTASGSAAEGDPLPKAEPENTSSPLGLDPSTKDKGDKIKDRNIEDLGKGAASAEELPVPQDNPNAAVPEGEVEVTRSAKKGDLSDPGGRVTERQKTGRQRAPKKDPLKEIEDLTQLPVAVAVGQVTASVEEYAGRPVLSISLRGWVGDAPLKILATDIGDLEQAIAELRSQLS